MNIGLILPATKKKKRNVLSRFYQTVSSLLLNALPYEIHQIEVTEDLCLMVCSLPYQDPEMLAHEGLRRRVRTKLVKIFEEKGAWPILEHPEVRGIYYIGNRGIEPESNDFFHPREYRFNDVLMEVIVNRFPEVLKLIQGIGNLSNREISVTGGSAHLEYAISRLITKVKAMNLLLPEGSPEPDEAEQAFAETGIPVHITTDHEVLNRTSIWLRFPDDHESFDALPESYKGMIVDYGAMKIIDTKNKKIFSVVLEFSDKIKRKIGHSILNGWEKGILEGVVIMVCANAWDISVTETSIRLGMRLSFKP